MTNFLDLPTLIIIGVAIVVLLRLRSVLGTRTGNERPPSDRIRPPAEQRSPKQQTGEDVVVPLRPQKSQGDMDESDDRVRRKFEAELDRYASSDKALRDGLEDIAKADPNFMPKQFLDGAGSAYEMIVTAFAHGDRKTLKELLDKDVYDSFEGAITERESNDQSVDFTFVGLPNIEMVEAGADKKAASVTVRFDAEVVSATKDKDGTLVEGDAENVVKISDEWTFARPTKSRDPNWKLVATNQIA